ncbi:MAG TPA: hypothetical protein VFU15_03250 [Bacteroidia bacterium]|nr:hypothetical protein [Bacteroidia bacterium]
MKKIRAGVPGLTGIPVTSGMKSVFLSLCLPLISFAAKAGDAESADPFRKRTVVKM